MLKDNPLTKHCVLVLDAVALRKEVKNDPTSGGYSGFVDCGQFQSSCSDSFATETLVFMVIGLTGHWKFPVAYCLADHLSGDVQAWTLRDTTKKESHHFTLLYFLSNSLNLACNTL